MFPPDMSGILPDNASPDSCGICGEPVAGAVSLPLPLPVSLPMPEGLPLGKPQRCKKCGQAICAKHFSASRQMCVKCETGRDSWCKTPGKPESK